jgi:RNA polymerase sigma-70 factor (ECF subfamily)
MPESDPMLQPRDALQRSFGNTDWWTVRQAGRLDEPDAGAARSSLCETYWNPVFHFILQTGYSWHDAQDLTQEFFSRLLKRNSVRTADRTKGKFRSFVLTLVKRFLADQRDRDHCLKRGGSRPMISLDQGDTEFRHRIEPRSELDPERICERQWVDSLLNHALAQLQQECASRGKDCLFHELQDAVAGQAERSYAAVADRLHLSEQNVRVTVHRLRQRLRDLLNEAIIEPGLSPTQKSQEMLQVYRST